MYYNFSDLKINNAARKRPGNYCYVKRFSKKISTIVSKPQHRLFEIYVNLKENILNLKSQIDELVQLTVDKLVYKCKRLDQLKTLETYGIDSGSYLHCTFLSK